MFEKYIKDNVLFIVPYQVRELILKYLSKQSKIYQITFLSLEEFLERYLYKIKEEEALAFLYDKTKTDFSILKEKLSYLYCISNKSTFKSPKLNDLRDLYKLLEDENLILKDPTFQEYLANFQIYVLGYPYLEQYQEEILKKCSATILKYDETYPLPQVYAFNTLEDEVSFVASQIKKLHEEGIPYRQIRLANILEEDSYLVKQIFNHFHIPLLGLTKHSLYATEVGKKFLLDFDIEAIKDYSIRKKIVQIENRLLTISRNSKTYSILMKEALKNTYLDEPLYEDAVSVIDFYELIPLDNVYTFVLGLNQNKLPKIFKDEAYLRKEELNELGAYTVREKNQKYKDITINILKSIPNLFLSYRIYTSNGSFYPSSCILEENMEVITQNSLDYKYSRTYSFIKTGELLDNFYTYGKMSDTLLKLLSSFKDLPYRTYNHTYKKVPFYLPNDKPFYLSYTSLNDYALCKFRYYAQYILKLNDYENSFSTTLGNIYHDVLAHIYDASFDFEEQWDKAISKYTLSSKEKVLLKRLKKELSFLIPVIEEQDSKSAFSKRLFEQKVEIPLGDNVFLKGFIDKIAFCELYGKIYYVLYDYKTGSVILDLTHIDDGLYLQLPLYQLLIEKGKLLPNPHFTGFFYQQLLLPSKNQKEKLANLKLRGYVLDDLEAISIFDETYENSEVIKGLKVTQNGYSRYSKVLSEEESNDLVNRTYKQVLKMKKAILESDFTINPKRLKNENISCKYCPYSDVCFYDEKDIVILKDVEVTE